VSARQSTIDALADRLLPRAGLGPRYHGLEVAYGEELDALAADPARKPPRALQAAILAGFYVQPEEAEAIGYPAPPPPPPPEAAPKTIRIEQVHGDTARLEADVCVVGSGAGGSVVAAELQARGLAVVVLEAGGYRNEADFHQLEARAAAELYLHGGLFHAEGGTIGILGGATLGGGTVVNSMVCLRPPDALRAEWAAAGLAGLDTDAFDAHLDAVWSRLSVGTDATQPNGVNDLLARTLEQCGHEWHLLPRNASADDDPRFCGLCNAGCQRGCKQSTLRTYLQDAADAGARFVVDCDVRRVLVHNGKAAGVEAVVGSRTALTVSAPTVIVAGGGIESPALLLRSGIGGPAVGRNLTLHPAFFVSGVHDEPMDGWSGQFQAVSTWEWAEDFLVECVGTSPGLWAGATPFVDAADHRRRMLDLRNVAAWHALIRDRGAGSVELGPDGRAVVRWQLDDPDDRRNAARAHVQLAKLHHAAGAREIYTFHEDDVSWRRGEDFDAFLATLERAPHDHVALSAHQMGTCRLGSDPATSVADGRGELHDARGAWIADASGFPSASGVNPMITIMALARRTALAVAGE
jgi:choline dehydrogenase-like flavoprotein